MSKIEQIIGEIEDYIDSCRFQPLSNTKIIVNKDEMIDYLNDLRQNIPDEVRKYQRIIANRDAILRDAQDKAEEMIRKANEMTSTLVSEHEIMQQAFREANIVIDDANAQANMIVENATAEANDLKINAIQYTDDALGNIQNILNTAIEGMTVKYDGVMRSLESSLEVTTRDRQALKDFFTKTKESLEDVKEEPVAEYRVPEPEPEAALQDDIFVDSTFEPVDDIQPEEADDITAGETLAQSGDETDETDDIPEVSDYGSIDEIKDFDLAFDDFK